MNNKLIVALFVGAISANQLPNINMLTVSTSDEGARALDNQSYKVDVALANLEKTKETNAVMQAGNEWYNTKEVQDFAGVL